MFKVYVDLDNSSGVAFSRIENYHIISTGRYTERKTWSWKDSTSDKEQWTIKSNRPFTVIVTGSYHQDGFNGHPGKKEKYIRVYQPEQKPICHSWVKEFSEPMRRIDYEVLQKIHNKIMGYNGNTYPDDKNLFDCVGWGERGKTSSGCIVSYTEDGDIWLDYWDFPADLSFRGTININNIDLPRNEILYRLSRHLDV
jgi:hypothetical protein